MASITGQNKNKIKETSVTRTAFLRFCLPFTDSVVRREKNPWNVRMKFIKFRNSDLPGPLCIYGSAARFQTKDRVGEKINLWDMVVVSKIKGSTDRLIGY